MDDVQQMIVNEINRLERVLKKRAKALEQLEAQSQLRTTPRRYVLEYVFPAVADNIKVINVPITRSFVVDKDCKRFFCQEVSCSIAAVGQIVNATNSNKITLPPSGNPGTLLEVVPVDFTWRIRDTATDREWQSQPLPRYFLASGQTAPLPMAWYAPLKPGAEIEVTIVPTAADPFVVDVFAELNSYTVQISFSGFEVL